MKDSKIKTTIRGQEHDFFQDILAFFIYGYSGKKKSENAHEGTFMIFKSEKMSNNFL